MAEKPRMTGPLLQIKISLQNTTPEIWRRLLVRSDISLGLLHAITQISMGWTNSHLHHFFIDGRRYVDPHVDDGSFEGGEKALDENEWMLLDVLRPDVPRIDYEYDFGDSWRHSITVERTETDSAGFQGYALCLAGERACPPEDCGGVSGFADFLEIIKDPEHGEYRSMREWVGGKYDPSAFDVEKVNRHLKKLKQGRVTVEQLGKILMARGGYRE